MCHVHSTMTQSSRFYCLIGVINKLTTDELCISPVYRRVAVAKCQPQCHHSIDFLFDSNRNHTCILYCFQDIAGYLSKVADFDPLTCIWRSNFVEIFGVRKLDSLGFCWRDPTFCRFSRTLTCDRQTDHADRHRRRHRQDGRTQIRG